MSSLRRFGLILVILVVAALTLWILFDKVVVVQAKLEASFAEAGRIIIVAIFGAITLVFIRRSKPLLSRHVGARPATIFQFLMELVAGVVVLFSILNIFQVSATTLLIGGGVVSIILGLIISTFVGNILAGTLVFMINPFKEGDSVLVNNVPGKIIEITAMVTRVRNDVGGQLVISNSAIVQGSVIITKVPANENLSEVGRLPYMVGDRVFTTYMSGEGVVTELTSFYTKILLDSGRKLTFLNNSVFSGSVAVAKVSAQVDELLRFSFKIDGDVEKVVKAIEREASSNPLLFKSTPLVRYLSLEGSRVELEFSCKTSTDMKSDAKSLVLKAAYLSSRSSQSSSV